ncbi:hypothetical protein R1sor_011779 [Riccia sorocarpa]|uniref:AB hydrolase-1 domain-containing protein n=1 Tax=Riccia sorocarpa TaxID=122646 RepID=A0ABD3I299_9MARC
MLEEVNFKIVVLDLISGRIDKTSPADVKTIANFSKPLTDYLSSINFKVLVVGHGIGGAAVTYAMEMNPDKIEKAIFVQAVMPKDGETPGLYINGQLATLAAQDVLNYNFNDKGVATSISINTTVAPWYLFNRSPREDKILGMALLTDSPYAILNEVMHLTPGNYGSIKRFYITTYMDRYFPASVQKQIYTNNPPKAKFILKNGDHSPFFSEAPYLFNHLRSLANSQW